MCIWFVYSFGINDSDHVSTVDHKETRDYLRMAYYIQFSSSSTIYVQQRVCVQR